MAQKEYMPIIATLGAISVALGAFGAHVVKNFLNSTDYDIYRTAVRYQMWHVLALFLVYLLHLQKNLVDFDKIMKSFIIGILLFSGSLYILVLTQLRWMGAVTPFGGVAFLFGWYFLIRFRIAE